MLVPGHVGASYLVTVGCAKLFRRSSGPISGKALRRLTLFGLCGGLISDVDVLLLIAGSGWDALGGRAGEHRETILHTPWFALVGLLALFVRVEQRQLWATIGVAVVLSHLILDSLVIGPGIRWLYPFSDQFYGVNAVARWAGVDWGDRWLTGYLSHPLFLIELALMAAALVAYRRRTDRS
jgi:membrane-bound metal-dependent hydrolase YbcI (DUF457 family)